jgi:hypothetical protein
MMKARVLVLVMVAVAALAVPASASHPNIMCLDVGMNERYGTADDDMIEYVRATIGTNDADHQEPFQEGCVPLEGDFQGTQIDFEISGAADPDSSDSPETPDMTCTVPPGNNGCLVTPPPSADGTQISRAWFDSDGIDATVEADRTEGYDQTTMPGDQPEPDGTDVMQWIWTSSEPRPECGTDDVCRQRVTIRYLSRQRTFFGEITKESAHCRPGRVTLWRVRPGDDRRIASRSGEIGEWRVGTYPATHGRYYATISKTYADVPNSEPPFTYECLPDRSRTVGVG